MPYSIWGEVWPALIYIFIYIERERERERYTSWYIIYGIYIYYIYILSIHYIGFGSCQTRVWQLYTVYNILCNIFNILYIIHYALYVIYYIMYTINTNTHKHKPEYNYSRNPRPWSLGCHQQTGSQKKKLGQ